MSWERRTNGFDSLRIEEPEDDTFKFAGSTLENNVLCIEKRNLFEQINNMKRYIYPSKKKIPYKMQFSQPEQEAYFLKQNSVPVLGMSRASSMKYKTYGIDFSRKLRDPIKKETKNQKKINFGSPYSSGNRKKTGSKISLKADEYESEGELNNQTEKTLKDSEEIINQLKKNPRKAVIIIKDEDDDSVFNNRIEKKRKILLDKENKKELFDKISKSLFLETDRAAKLEEMLLFNFFRYKKNKEICDSLERSIRQLKKINEQHFFQKLGTLEGDKTCFNAYVVTLIKKSNKFRRKSLSDRLRTCILN